MRTKADEFILDVRRAARTELKPTFTTDSELISPQAVTGVLQRATHWLTPKIVEDYDPAAFLGWPGTVQTELGNAVNDFRAVVAAVPSLNHATGPQLEEGVRAFARLKAAVQTVALSEWLQEAGKLVGHVETWAKELGWVTRRQSKHLNELLLGDYTLQQLYMHAEGNLYILDPIARFIPDGLGAFDLSIQPSFFTTSIYRQKEGEWLINLDVGRRVRGSKKELLSASSLRQAVNELKSLL